MGWAGLRLDLRGVVGYCEVGWGGVGWGGVMWCGVVWRGAARAGVRWGVIPSLILGILWLYEGWGGGMRRL